jgi:RimJ/RimL family protein N-acetyltransferase
VLIDRARAPGWHRLAVQGVYTSNERARRLFERAGFVVTGCGADEQGVARWQMERRFREGDLGSSACVG